MVARESQLVELVDADGAATGSCTVAEAHTAPGRLHRAFSVMLLDDLGRVLIQQRAAEKTRFALRWANACCGHPAPGQTVVDAAAQRLIEEIGIPGVTLHQAGVHPYWAEDPQTNRVEHEYDHVLVGRVPVDPRLHLDPAEVADVRWLALDRLRVDLADNPDRYSPWLDGVLAVATEAAGRLPAAAALASRRQATPRRPTVPFPPVWPAGPPVAQPAARWVARRGPDRHPAGRPDRNTD
jgi:isopentenyl-diphosphate delta-isomerase